MEIKEKIRTISDWPKPGIMFKDITPLLADKDSFKQMVDLLAEHYKDFSIDKIVAIESRGFIIGSALAIVMGLGFVPIRKKGKLPAETVMEEYELEYGKDKIEMHLDSLKKGEKVLLVDDLVATGGTALAACRLIEKVGAKIVNCVFVIDLPDLQGSKKLQAKNYEVFNLISF